MAAIKPPKTPLTNSMPRLTSLVDPSTGKINNAYVGFFSRMNARTGPGINPVTDAMTLEQIGASVNALLQEARSQGWIETGKAGSSGNFAEAIRAVTMIPASGDFCYSTTAVQELKTQAVHDLDSGIEVWPASWLFMNAWSTFEGFPVEGYPDLYELTCRDDQFPSVETDMTTSLNDLQSQVPNIKNVSLLAGWFGTDLRASQCIIRPGIDNIPVTDVDYGFFGLWPKKKTGKIYRPLQWSVDIYSSHSAPLITRHLDKAAYGSTPADSSVMEGIVELKRRGLAVTFTPFLFMDIPTGSTLPSPYGGTQPPYPWRGRVTIDDGLGGTADKTAVAAAQIDTFVNREWGYRRFILHYARLCAEAGGVDTFVIGSEMRGLTWARSDATTHPFVDALASLAAEVKAILPDANIVYTADWSENLNYRPDDGSGDVIFHLDKLFMSPDIAAVAFDNYWPLSDWRDVPMDGPNNIDQESFESIYDFEYLMGNVQGGEGYDWYYASAADRTNQVRTPITDGAYGEPWIYRYKDITSWWQNRHYNRIGGIRQADPTDWVPESKPIWMMETGAPAVDKGSNQPNVFVDPKSSESFYPYFSNSIRDDLNQQRYIHSMLRFFDDTDSSFVEMNNPQSSVYDGRMVDANRIYIYTWDARPYPFFPDLTGVWSDGLNYSVGDWITGRIPAPADPTQVIGGDMAQLRTILAPRDPHVVNPQNGELTKQWLIFFQTLGFTQGGAISNLSSNPTASEIAAALNALLAVLRDQKRIASG